MKRAILLATAITTAQAAELKLNIHGDGLDGKTLLVRLFDAPAQFPSGRDHVRESRTTSAAGGTTLLLRDLAPGRYALAVFADLNGNGKLDRNWFGLPAEPYGFSNDARSLTGPPDYSSAAFDLNDAGATQSIHLH